jgi:hypothetical protein
MRPLPVLLVAVAIVPLVPQCGADCIPCRYGASTVTCPQAAGTDPKDAMTDFACLCARQADYETVLKSCLKTADLPASCDPADQGELDRIRDACKKKPSDDGGRAAGTTPATTTTRQQQQQQNTRTASGGGDIVFSTLSAGQGRETTLVQSVGERIETYTVTYFTSSSSPAPGAPQQTPAQQPDGSRPSSPDATASAAGPPNSPARRGAANGAIIGASVGAAVGVILVGIAAVELAKRSKRAENRRVEEEVTEAIRGMVVGGARTGAVGTGYGQNHYADGPAEPEEDGHRAELAVCEKPAELEG